MGNGVLTTKKSKATLNSLHTDLTSVAPTHRFDFYLHPRLSQAFRTLNCSSVASTNSRT
jgi:hypothetical protein